MFYPIPYPCRIPMHQPLPRESYAFCTSRKTWNSGSCAIPDNFCTKFASKVAAPMPLPALIAIDGDRKSVYRYDLVIAIHDALPISVYRYEQAVQGRRL